MQLRSNIIYASKRYLSHHYEPIKYPVSSFINYFNQYDKIKIDETNKNVKELLTRLETIDKKVTTIDFFIFINLLGSCMFIPALILIHNT